MRDKTVVLTGGTSGIGFAGAEALARLGARIVLVARDPQRAEDALRALRRIAPDRGHAVHLADLSSLPEMKRVAAAIAAAEPRIDVLVNNAGALFDTRATSVGGLERTFTLNHLSYFVLTDALLPSLLATDAARVVNTSSEGHRFAKLNLDDLQSAQGYGGLGGFNAYCRSKLCNLLFTTALAKRIAGTKVTANAFHPGFVASRFGDGNGGATRHMLGLAKSLFAVSPARGAETLVHLAASPEVAGRSGGYYAHCRSVAPSRAARDAVAAERLWQASVDIAGLGETLADRLRSSR